MGFEFLTVVPWVCAFLFTVGVSLFIYLIATGPSSAYERKYISQSRRINQIINGSTVPEEPQPAPCYLTEQIHEAAREAGLCVECGEECGGWYPNAPSGSPRMPKWVCGKDRGIPALFTPSEVKRFRTVMGADGATYRVEKYLDSLGFKPGR